MATLSLENQHTAVQLYLSGKSARQVAEHFAVRIDAIYYALRRQNIPRRSVQESNTIDFANSDPGMAVIFIKFLRDICGVTEDRIRCSLYCYEGQDIPALTTFWSTLLDVPENRFTKPYIKKGDTGVRGPRMIHGLVHVRYCDKKLLSQVLQWIQEYCAKCVGG